MKDYSQAGEQEAILAALPGDPARFLDIGAWNPHTFSNTRALYELGWSGVLIEPSPEPMLACLKEYGFDERITLIQAAVGFERVMTEMFVTADAVSTDSRDQYEKWKQVGGYQGKLFVPQITLEELSNQFGGFDFINIDAEGISCELFIKAAIELKWRPRCWCIEHDGRTNELLHVATANAYTATMVNQTNVVLVSR